jgi:hypothetical protein
MSGCVGINEKTEAVQKILNVSGRSVDSAAELEVAMSCLGACQELEI